MQRAVRLASCLTRMYCMQVLAAPKTAELRIGDVTLKRERWLVDALQQRLFMRVSAMRQFFRVRPASGLPCPLMCARCPGRSPITLAPSSRAESRMQQH